MPNSAPLVCAMCGVPGCKLCSPRALDFRASAAKRGYDRTWRKVREAILAREPLCRVCTSEGRVRPADEVHHERPIKERPDLRLSPANLIPVCRPCHRAIERT
jgi:5-methylcytosine-specific restriction enzyme A